MWCLTTFILNQEPCDVRRVANLPRIYCNWEIQWSGSFKKVCNTYLQQYSQNSKDNNPRWWIILCEKQDSGSLQQIHYAALWVRVLWITAFWQNSYEYKSQRIFLHIHLPITVVLESYQAFRCVWSNTHNVWLFAFNCLFYRIPGRVDDFICSTRKTSCQKTLI